MHHYAPRSHKRGANAELWRALRPGLGIHAAFLSFDLEDDESVQIGLGGTFSFWENRLQAGVGYNLMSDSRDDGRYYSFIGSDLIGILQSLGLVNP